MCFGSVTRRVDLAGADCLADASEEGGGVVVATGNECCEFICECCESINESINEFFYESNHHSNHHSTHQPTNQPLQTTQIPLSPLSQPTVSHQRGGVASPRSGAPTDEHPLRRCHHILSLT